MAGPGLATNNDAAYPDSAVDPSVKVHQQDHDKIAAAVNLLDTSNTATSGHVLVGDGSTLITRPLTSTDNPGIVRNTRTASYTAVASDAGKLIEMNVATSNTLTIPGSVFQADQVIVGSQYGAGTTSIVQGSGMTLRSRGGLLASAGQYAGWTITFRSASEAVVEGDLA